MRQDSGALDVRSERNIATLLPKMQDLARRIMKIARGREDKTKLYAVVLSGTRTYAEQDGLYAQKPKVTNARGGQSNHNFGIAIDIGLFKDGKYLTGNTKAEKQAYADLAKAVKLQLVDVDWGGDWATFKDMPHYEYKTGLTIAQKRTKFEKGQLTL